MRWLILALTLLAAFVPAHAGSDGGWVIARNDIELEIRADGVLAVTETITADFQVPKHGIIRVLPVRYAAGLHQYALRFQLLEVTDDQGRRYGTKVSKKGNAVRIRIGSPDQTLRGRNIYRISYLIERALLWEDDRVVLRWNAIGHEWDVPNQAGSVVVHLPADLGDDEVISDAWTGGWGNRGKDFRSTRDDDGSLRIEIDALRPHEGMTLSVSLPATAVERAPWIARAGLWLVDNVVYALFPLVLAICIWMWRRRGRDLPGAGSIVVQYGPPGGFTPAEVGTLIDEKVDLRDLSATIIGFATRGLLTIETTPGSWITSPKKCTLTKVKRPADLKRHEALLFDELFVGGDSVQMEDIREQFHLHVDTVTSSLYKDLTDGGYFDGAPDSRRSTFTSLGITLTLALFGAAAIAQVLTIGRLFPVPWVIAGILSLIAVIVTGRVMPRKTSKGRRAWEHIAGLEEYIRRAEAGTIADAEKRGIFEHLLPYAMIFGLANVWAEAFEGIYTTPPDWYQTPGRRDFSTAWLADDLSKTSDHMQASLLTPPRSSGSSGSSGGWSSGGFSGGGSSGGGFGGGGGSSW